MDELTKTFYLNLFLSLLVTFGGIWLLFIRSIYTKTNWFNLLAKTYWRGLRIEENLTKCLSCTINATPKEIRSLTLLLIDIDDFKSVNDTFGHLVGDQTLVHTARILKEQLRQSDTIARWGGEEFAILLSNIEENMRLKSLKRYAMPFKTMPHWSHCCKDRSVA